MLWRILAKVGERHAEVAVVGARDTKLRGRPSRAPLPAREAERRATLATVRQMCARRYALARPLDDEVQSTE